MYLYMYISRMQSSCGDSEILQSWQSKDALSKTRKSELEEARQRRGDCTERNDNGVLKLTVCIRMERIYKDVKDNP